MTSSKIRLPGVTKNEVFNNLYFEKCRLIIFLYFQHRLKDEQAFSFYKASTKKILIIIINAISLESMVKSCNSNLTLKSGFAYFSSEWALML